MNNLPKYDDFRDSLVAFIDILGFDKSVRNISNREEFFEIGKLLYATLETTNELSKAGDILEEYKFTAISDSIIVTVPFDNPTCTTGMLQILHNIQYEMLGTSFKTLVRGYITRGPVYHKNGLLFGAGYSDAYKGEGMIGGAPRIVLDPKIVTDAKRVIESAPSTVGLVTTLDYLTEDKSDGFHFIDYLKPTGGQGTLPHSQLIEERMLIKDFINESLLNFENQCKVRAKYKWLENYFGDTAKYFE